MYKTKGTRTITSGNILYAEKPKRFLPSVQGTLRLRLVRGLAQGQQASKGQGQGQVWKPDLSVTGSSSGGPGYRTKS